MSILRRGGTDGAEHVKGSSQENFQRIPTFFQKARLLLQKQGRILPNAVSRGLAARGGGEADTGGRANSCGSAVPPRENKQSSPEIENEKNSLTRSNFAPVVRLF